MMSEIFAFNQTGLQAEEVEWLLLSRGMARETSDKLGVRVAGPPMKHRNGRFIVLGEPTWVHNSWPDQKTF